MGLFGSIIGGLTGGLGTLFSAGQNKKAVRRAAEAQLTGQREATAEQARQFDLTRSDYAPFTGAGAAAIGDIGDITGINGDPAQQAALDQLRASPFFQSLFRTGEEAVLQNASATGGLRGGNTHRSLADFGADTFMQTIQQQLANLGGIASLGSGVTTNLGALGAEKANNISNIAIQGGNTRAGSILGQQQINNNLQSQLQKLITSFIPGGGGLTAGGF